MQCLQKENTFTVLVVCTSFIPKCMTYLSNLIILIIFVKYVIIIFLKLPFISSYSASCLNVIKGASIWIIWLLLREHQQGKFKNDKI